MPQDIATFERFLQIIVRSRPRLETYIPIRRDGWGYRQWKIGWKRYARIAERLEREDFGCRFNSEGKCLAMQHNQKYQGCCTGCGSQNAYLQAIEEKEIPMYLSLWDEEKGFLGEKGCKLPRRLRSWICLRYACMKSMVEMDKRLVQIVEKTR